MNHEVGFIVCRKNRGGVPRAEVRSQDLSRGPTRHGDHSSVNIPVKCPQGTKPAALWHTHPSGSLELSRADIRTGREHKIPQVCVSNGKPGATKCYHIRK